LSKLEALFTVRLIYLFIHPMFVHKRTKRHSECYLYFWLFKSEEISVNIGYLNNLVVALLQSTRLTFLCFLLLVSYVGSAQTDVSALAPTEQQITSTEKIDALLGQVEAQINEDSRTALKDALKAHEAATLLDYSDGVLRASIVISDIYINYQLDYYKGLEYLWKAHALAQEKEDFSKEASILRNIAFVYYTQGNYKEALSYFNQALDLAKESLGDTEVSQIHAYIGAMYEESNEMDKALLHYLSVLAIERARNFENTLPVSIITIAHYYELKEDFVTANNYYLQALKQFQESKDVRWAAYTYSQLCHLRILQNDFVAAREFGELGIALAEKHLLGKELADNHEALAVANDSLHNYEAAYRHQKQYTLLRDSLFNIEKAEQLSILQSSIDSELKDTELRRLRSEELRMREAQEMEQANQSLFNSIVFIVLGGVLLLGIMFYFRMRTKQTLNKQLSLQKDALEEANAELEKLSLVASKTDNYVIICNAKDKIVWVNKSFVRLSGYSLEESVGRRPSTLLNGENTSLATCKSIDEHIFVKGVSFKGEILNYDKFNKPFWANINITPLYDEQGELDKYFVMGSDINAIKTTENSLSIKNEAISTNLNYANCIQRSMLPSLAVLKEPFADAFVFFEPMDFVSGDFYWTGHNNNKTILAVADCTGHGVSGALMSAMGMNLLNQAINVKRLERPSEILDYLQQSMQQIFTPSVRDELQMLDGIDISIVSIDTSNREITFAGASSRLFYIDKGELHTLRGNKTNIKAFTPETESTFTEHTLWLNPGAQIYLMTDGFADQFGGKANKKLGFPALSNHILLNYKESLENQKAALQQALEAWKGDAFQVDDICIVGVLLD